jgi:hypothetical protein
MKTAEETVQEFLFKDKPKRSYCHKRDVNDWVNLLQKFAIEYHESKVKNLNIPDVSAECEHPFAFVNSKCNGEINQCLKCGKML